MITEALGDQTVDTLAPAVAALPATEQQPSCPRVWAAVICYRGNSSRIRRLCEALKPQVNQVLLLDNGEGPDKQELTVDSVRTIPMQSNLGTGGAMNVAWQLALYEGIDYMVCFDQDSQVDSNLIETLLNRWRALQAQGIRVGAIGPTWRDPRTGRSIEALRPTRWRRQRVPTHTRGAVEVDHLITSGCLIGAKTMREVGPFNAEFFLDYVDIEWSLRSRHCGYCCFITGEAQMRHEIGDQVISIMGKSLWVHQPNRHYFLVRNHLLLWRMAHVTLPWKIRDAIQVLIKISLLVLLQPPRRMRLAWAFRGFLDGLRGRSGPTT